MRCRRHVSVNLTQVWLCIQAAAGDSSRCAARSPCGSYRYSSKPPLHTPLQVTPLQNMTHVATQDAAQHRRRPTETPSSPASAALGGQMAAVMAECASNVYNAAMVPAAERLTYTHASPENRRRRDGSTCGKTLTQHTPAQGPKAELRNDAA